jgi:rhamnosyltransferase
MTAVPVIMRTRNDQPLVAETLAMLHRQTRSHELIVFDNDSHDGTRALVERQAARVHTVRAGQYVPGRVLNRAMETTTGELVVFLNADCTPIDEHWLAALLAAFEDDNTAAVFGRQIPRPDCNLLLAKDTEDTYGDGQRQARWRHCFSMAASAIRRSVWERLRFSETLRYSEDIDWTWQARRRGHHIRYAPAAAVLHSHDYSLRQFYRRQYGEGCAEAHIFDWSTWQTSFLRYSLMPFTRQVIGDVQTCLHRGAVGTALYSPALRLAQMLGRRAGFRQGRRERIASP